MDAMRAASAASSTALTGHPMPSSATERMVKARAGALTSLPPATSTSAASELPRLIATSKLAVRRRAASGKRPETMSSFASARHCSSCCMRRNRIRALTLTTHAPHRWPRFSQDLALLRLPLRGRERLRAAGVEEHLRGERLCYAAMATPCALWGRPLSPRRDPPKE